ncbi:MAG: hypothetical protein QM607_12490 [Microbacterium sp.]
MVFDVESIGLHGEGYAVGYVVIHNGQEVESGMFACLCGMAEGVDSDRLWVYENIPALQPNSPDPFTVREKFWRRWVEWKAKGALLAADCAWPVEARFLAACVDALPDDRRFAGPYPLVEISTWMMAAGHDAMKDYARTDRELPKHNPLADARQSARLLMEAIEATTREWPNAKIQP